MRNEKVIKIRIQKSIIILIKRHEQLVGYSQRLSVLHLRAPGRVHASPILLTPHLLAVAAGPNPQPVALGLNYDPIHSKELHARPMEPSPSKQRDSHSLGSEVDNKREHIQPILRDKTQ